MAWVALFINFWCYIKLWGSWVGNNQILCDIRSDKFAVFEPFYCIADQFVVFLHWIIFLVFSSCLRHLADVHILHFSIIMITTLSVCICYCYASSPESFWRFGCQILCSCFAPLITFGTKSMFQLNGDYWMASIYLLIVIWTFIIPGLLLFVASGF